MLQSFDWNRLEASACVDAAFPSCEQCLQEIEEGREWGLEGSGQRVSWVQKRESAEIGSTFRRIQMNRNTALPERSADAELGQTTQSDVR